MLYRQHLGVKQVQKHVQFGLLSVPLHGRESFRGIKIPLTAKKGALGAKFSLLPSHIALETVLSPSITGRGVLNFSSKAGVDLHSIQKIIGA